MQNKLLCFLRQHRMLQPGDTVICGVSGGADSMALLWAMHLLGQKLQLQVQAAHFNHHLRGGESDRDEAFVRGFCKEHQIPCHVGGAWVEPGPKGLEAAAREARYGFLHTLPGKVATAHTANDNAETLLMHLLRGTGLKGLGGIAPVRGNLIRPMLTVTREEVLAFLAEHRIPYVTDSSNGSDAFLRNRLRHHVMPLLATENPCIAETLSGAALRLRLDEEVLDAQGVLTMDVEALRQMHPALQTRALEKLLRHFGVKEPETVHIDLLRRILYSENPSAYGEFPGAVRIGREYGRLVKLEPLQPLGSYLLQVPGLTYIPELELEIHCRLPGEKTEGLLLRAEGALSLRGRREGDTIVLPGGRKLLKKLLIDRKIPAHQRSRIPVLADDAGVAAVLGIGVSQDRLENPNIEILCKPTLRETESEREENYEK